MERDRYVYRQHTDTDPATAEARIREALAAEGFGILSEIDVEATLKNKLDVEVGSYRILGACKPSYAHQALQLDPALGGLLPCNVVVRAHEDGGSEILVVDAEAMLGLADSADLEPIAGTVAEELSRALSAAVS